MCACDCGSTPRCCSTPTMSYLWGDWRDARRRVNTANAASNSAIVPLAERLAFGNEQLQASLAVAALLDSVLPEEPARAVEPPAPLVIGDAPAAAVCAEAPAKLEPAPPALSAPALPPLPPLFALPPPALLAPPPLTPELLAPAPADPP